MTALTESRIDSARRAREARFEDARDLMSWGVHPDEIARRLGCTRSALEMQARRHGAPDIYEWVRVPREHRPPRRSCDCGELVSHRATRCRSCYDRDRGAA